MVVHDEILYFTSGGSVALLWLLPLDEPEAHGHILSWDHPQLVETPQHWRGGYKNLVLNGDALAFPMAQLNMIIHVNLVAERDPFRFVELKASILDDYWAGYPDRVRRAERNGRPQPTPGPFFRISRWEPNQFLLEVNSQDRSKYSSLAAAIDIQSGEQTGLVLYSPEAVYYNIRMLSPTLYGGIRQDTSELHLFLKKD